MSISNVEKLLNRLDGALGKHKAKNKVDFKELSEARKRAFYKMQPGKNNLAFITPTGAEDPFVFWGYHNGLQEVAWYSTPCNAYNQGEDCLICNAVEELKKENWEGNKHLWMPIKQKIEAYTPAINLESEATIREGIKWVRIPNSALSQMTEWLRNLERDEEPFFSDDQTQKIIINYTKTAAPADQYKLDRKNMKPFSTQQLADWRGELTDLKGFFIPKSESQIKDLLDGYFSRISDEVQVAPNETATEEPTNETATEDEIVVKKLDHLKRKRD